jgi:formylmethanofuran dehydrogenase subunit D
MSTISINLISGRTIQQGASMEGGKDTDKYMKACGIIEIDDSDFKRLEIMKNTNVRVTSEFGNVVVKAVEATQGPHPGVAFIPMGPWANSVISPETYSTGMPTFKGVPITIEPAENEKVLTSIELVREKCWGDA